MATIPIERSFSLKEAEASLLGELERLGLDHTIEIAGEFVHAARCTIADKSSGQFLASGNGKGDRASSRVGSLFEAAEHLFSKYRHIDPSKVTHMDSLDYWEGYAQREALPLILLRDGANAEIPFLEYQAIGRDQSCRYPLALVCPEYIDLQLSGDGLRSPDLFNYGRLEQYSTNSGTAIGMNREEALIHGLLESIERTSLSEFLANTFLLNKQGCLCAIDASTLPPNIGHVLDLLKHEISSEIMIFEMPNKFGIPAYVSWMDQCNFKIGLAGYGCSLSLEHAILRSLYELGQYFGLSKFVFGFDWLRSKAAAIPIALEGLPLHQDCAVFDLGAKCRKLGYELVNYESLPTVSFASEPKAYLAQLTSLIHAGAELPYATELRALESGITVMHTFITGEDRFFNVTNGKSTFPASFAKLALVHS